MQSATRQHVKIEISVVRDNTKLLRSRVLGFIRGMQIHPLLLARLDPTRISRISERKTNNNHSVSSGIYEDG